MVRVENQIVTSMLVKVQSSIRAAITKTQTKHKAGKINDILNLQFVFSLFKMKTN